MIPFPFGEIYDAVLNRGWKIRELWRKNGEIYITVYCPCPAMETFIRLTGADWESALEQTQHLEFSLYEDENEL